MIKPIAIVAGEPNSISSEIIFKSWKLKNKYTHKPFFVIGSIKLLELQKNKLKYRFKIKEIKKNFNIKKLNGKELSVLNIDYMQKKPFQKITKSSNKYILKCLDVATKLIREKKISSFINCPVCKEILFKNKQFGVTEFLSKRAKVFGSEAMLIYNRDLSVSPLTTHIPLSFVSKKINKLKIIKKVEIINKFYKKHFKKKVKFGILGLNPHGHTTSIKNEEKDIIIPAIKAIKKLKIKVEGPISPDTSFMIYKKKKIDVIIGMYHDQVLTPFKTLFNYNAINITLGLPYIRISPDHGTAENILGKNLANPKSLIESIKFFNNIRY
jgi:4-hydroxythreonine-4-phosphate dehydrogenase